MKKRTAILAIMYVMAVAVLSFLVVELVNAHRRIHLLESQTQVGAPGSTPQQAIGTIDKQAATVATELAKSISGVHETLANVSPHKRTKILTGEQAQAEAARRRELAVNRSATAGWSADDVANQLKNQGIVHTVSEPTWQRDPAMPQANPAQDVGRWGALCQTNDGKSLLVARVAKQPQLQRTAIATSKSYGLRPYSWGNFVLGFADDIQRDAVVAALPRID